MFSSLKYFLENIDRGRDKALSTFIRRYWPRWILPNHLTTLRIILAFFIFYLLALNLITGMWMMLIFVFAALLDLFDGSVARCLDEVTSLGAVLDLIADKVLILPIALYVLVTSHFWLLLILLIFPEIITGLMIFYHRFQNRFLMPSIFAKVKMVVECFAFAFIILFNFPDKLSIFPVILLYIGSLLAFLNIFSNYSNPVLRINHVKTI